MNLYLVSPPRECEVTLPSDASRLAGPELPADDWDLLFDAILARLRRGAGGPPAQAAAMRELVLDCVPALEHLHATLAHERGYAFRIERELQETYAALAEARAELAATPGGEQRVRHPALHDSLTSLPDRGSFRARLDDALSPGQQPLPALAVLRLELDGYKPINELHGDATGAELLRIVAQRLRHSLRAKDMVCRLSGDEFACLLSEPMGHDQLSHLACKLFDAVSAPLRVGPLDLCVRPSIGIAVCPTDGDTTPALLKRADAAMYHAKRHQTGYAFFERGADA
jgi:diguanylate cyclase (GGDEF)-like protein